VCLCSDWNIHLLSSWNSPRGVVCPWQGGWEEGSRPVPNRLGLAIDTGCAAVALALVSARAIHTCDTVETELTLFGREQLLWPFSCFPPRDEAAQRFRARVRAQVYRRGVVALGGGSVAALGAWVGAIAVPAMLLARWCALWLVMPEVRGRSIHRPAATEHGARRRRCLTPPSAQFVCSGRPVVTPCPRAAPRPSLQVRRAMKGEEHRASVEAHENFGPALVGGAASLSLALLVCGVLPPAPLAGCD
jgi:hypothetical protein